jgi:hypothetical protein
MDFIGRQKAAPADEMAGKKLEINLRLAAKLTSFFQTVMWNAAKHTGATMEKRSFCFQVP